MSNRAIYILVSFILCVPLLALAHELLVIVVAATVSDLPKGEFLYQLVKQFLASPVHAKIMIETLGGIQTQGIVVAGLPGQILHTLAPSVFIAPDALTVPAGVSAVVSKHSTVLGFYTTQSIVEFITTVIGALVLQSGLKKRSLRSTLKTASVFDVWRVLIGLFLMAQAIWAAFSLTMSPALAGLRETGLGVGFSLVFQVNKQQYNWLMDQALPLLIPTILILAAIGTAWLIGKLFQGLLVIFRRSTPATSPSLSARIFRKVKLGVILVALLVLSPISQNYFGIANTTLVAPTPRIVLAPTPQVMEIAVVAHPTPTWTPTPTITPTPLLVVATPTITPSPTPSPTATPVRGRRVELNKNGTRFSLIVNGRPTYVQGLNYNVNYTALPNDIKRKYHHRDFQIMRDAGINVVIGWGVYDHVTLEIAHEYGIGVIMPFELDAKGAYENKNYRDHIKNEFRKFVLEYKDAPAVWGWNPGGDELLHRMETEQHRTPDKLQIASDFLVELAMLAHSLDPNRVSIIKEPRDWYVPYIEESIRRVRLQRPAFDPSRYLIFATNTYGKPDGVALVLHTTRKSVEERLGIAFAVGEFAPFGLARSERPVHYAMIWNTVKETSTIGGFAYVFGPDQPNPKAPNPYDPLRLLVSEFSLVDNDGKPVDGSLNALSFQWRAIPVNSLTAPGEMK